MGRKTGEGRAVSWHHCLSAQDPAWDQLDLELSRDLKLN